MSKLSPKELSMINVLFTSAYVILYHPFYNPSLYDIESAVQQIMTPRTDPV
jgi:hypothetical protein